jgi:uncharacterized delta-60 repeat protein
VAKRTTVLIALLFIALASRTGFAAAAPGDIDRSFGHKGVAELASNPSGFPNDMAIGPGGVVYVLRSRDVCQSPSAPPCMTEQLVSRFRPNGSPDASFGTNGIRGVFGLREQGNSGSLGHSLAVGKDGKVIVAAVDHEGPALARLNPNGGLDRSFGDQGVARIDLGVQVSRLSVAVQGDGRIVVAAEPVAFPPATTVVVARYTRQGAPDPTFNRGAPAVANLGSELGAFDLAGDGGTVFAGSPPCCLAGGSDVHVARLDAHGFADRRFGSGGRRFAPGVAQPLMIGTAIALRDGRIDVVGEGGGNAFAMRLLPGGRLDPAFGRAGIAYMQGVLSTPRAAVDGHGRLVVAGEGQISSAAGLEPFVLQMLRRLPDGRRDRTFGGGSPVFLHPPESGSPFEQVDVIGVGFQPRDRPVALISVGSCVRVCTSPRTMLVRYLGGDSRARCRGQMATIVGTRGGEELVGTSGQDVIAALGGDDVVRGRAGNDLICGGRGNDRLVGGPGHDRFGRGPGRDRIRQ